METLQITPVMAQRRSLNFGEYAEDATLVMKNSPQGKRDRYSLKPTRLKQVWSI